MKDSHASKQGFEKDSARLTTFTLCRNSSRSREYKMMLCLIFIDLKKAFDPVEMEAVVEALDNQGVPTQYIKVLRELYSNFTTGILPFYKIIIDVKRGSDSVIQFHPKYSQNAMRKLEWDDMGVKVDGGQLHHLRFADRSSAESVIVLITPSISQAERMLIEFDETCGCIGLQRNLQKTMFMRNGWISDTPFTLNGTNISECTSYVYLGRELNMMNDLTPELGRRRRVAWGAYKSIEDVVKKTRNTRLGAHLFNTTVLPALTYASETWAFRKQEENAGVPQKRRALSSPGQCGKYARAARARSRPKKLVRHRQQHPVRLATLNVGTLTGRSRELADSLRKRRVDICCVQETRWKGSKARELGDGYKLIYHGTSNRNGVGIILNESFRNSVTAVDRLSDRLMAVKVDTGEVELRVVSAYAPQMGCSEEEKACFWEDLEQYVRSLESEEVLLIGGDFNGHVGSRKDGFESCHGGYGYGARNDDGLRILEYAVASDLIIANTQYRKRKSHLITYTSGGRETQIDFWMLRRRDCRLLQDSKVIPTDHVAAQHHLLVMDLKISRPRKRHPRTETQRIKWWNLKDRKEVFFASVAPSTLPHPTRSVEEMWLSTSSVIRLTAENTLGKTTLGKPKVRKATWFWNEEVQAAIREKKSKYKLWCRTRQPEDRGAYLAAKREAKKAVSKAKSDRYKAVYDMLDTREGERAVYRLVRARHRSTLDMEHTKIVKGADGAALVRSWRGGESTTITCVTKSSVILPSQPFPASRVLFYQLLPSKSVLPSQK
ncbi:hypothetical protein RB195_024719 [Necator americanus]|uniref:Endonuclease/exonuclease/phosphatase domain-containing protein n=1 Tax=Necator americanus TaxID=51031 RepID=A0ABR1EPC9_NECAM